METLESVTSELGYGGGRGGRGFSKALMALVISDIFWSCPSSRFGRGVVAKIFFLLLSLDKVIAGVAEFVWI